MDEANARMVEPTAEAPREIGRTAGGMLKQANPEVSFLDDAPENAIVLSPRICTPNTHHAVAAVALGS